MWMMVIMCRQNQHQCKVIWKKTNQDESECDKNNVKKEPTAEENEQSKMENEKEPSKEDDNLDYKPEESEEKRMELILKIVL